MSSADIPSFANEYVTLKASYDNAVTLLKTNTKKIIVLNFKALQLLRIKSLQQELFTLQMKFILGGITLEEYPTNLEQLDLVLSNYRLHLCARNVTISGDSKDREGFANLRDSRPRQLRVCSSGLHALWMSR